MRGRRSNKGWRIATELDNWGDGRCMACPGKREGRMEERMLYSLGFLSAGVDRGYKVGLRLAFAMVPRILMFEHWEQWTGQDTGEREDRAF